MDDITSRDDEKRLDLAREQGRREEQDLQRERELATEKGRKEGRDEERAQETVRTDAQENAREKPKEGWGTGVKIIVSLIVLAIIVTVIALLTLSVSVTDVSASYDMPYTARYSVTFPEGQTIAIGNSHMSVLSYQNELLSDIDGDQQKLLEGGYRRIIPERRAVITTLGVIKILDTNFQIILNYKGNRDNFAYFDVEVHTTKQVPDILLRQLLPAEIHAQPM